MLTSSTPPCTHNHSSLNLLNSGSPSSKRKNCQDGQSESSFLPLHSDTLFRSKRKNISHFGTTQENFSSSGNQPSIFPSGSPSAAPKDTSKYESYIRPKKLSCVELAVGKRTREDHDHLGSGTENSFGSSHLVSCPKKPFVKSGESPSHQKRSRDELDPEELSLLALQKKPYQKQLTDSEIFAPKPFDETHPDEDPAFNSWNYWRQPLPALTKEEEAEITGKMI